ncbi:hypothetical protein M409DRAFT_27991 [Zasmidium cellare ATCC 36951]|uniref:Uncharacterized protein n=1 Tax=Zasmidium cellare ATCC 36951 TaxID=1080233 RepID=A0A6A6C855_ZASCE|nr:uncharacterized protein M409DRAFT_27991 [Zasmidium cellare ATCC 36951]KAF2161596.1 hypothetical protein M409DRAFT_27991 [Zasmidium cellare ATCC 36951]
MRNEGGRGRGSGESRAVNGGRRKRLYGSDVRTRPVVEKVPLVGTADCNAVGGPELYLTEEQASLPMMALAALSLLNAPKAADRVQASLAVVMADDDAAAGDGEPPPLRAWETKCD